MQATAPAAAPARPARRGLAVIGRVLPVPRRLDLVVLGCAITLSVLGILFVSSTTQGGRFDGLATRQTVWVRRGPGSDARRGSLRLPGAAEVLVRHLPREPRPSRLSPLLRREDRERQIVDPDRRFSVPAGGARESGHRSSSRVPLRERGRREDEAGHCREGRNDRRHPVPAGVSPAGRGPRRDVSPAARRRSLLRRPAAARVGGPRHRRRAPRRDRVVRPRRLPEGADRHVPEPRGGRARLRLPGPPVEDRRGFRRVLRARDSDPARRASSGSCRCSTPTSSWR